MVKSCATCGKRITGAAQRRYCSPCRVSRYKATITYLKPGDPIPDGEPRRYVASHGYVRLRWRTGKYAYVETYEHRVFDGRVTAEEHVHHINQDRADNRPANLRPLSSAEHAAVHGNPSWWVRAARLYSSGASTYEVGKAVSRNPATVYRALVEMGVPLRKHARIAIPKRELPRN